MRVRSILMVAFLASALACSHQSEPVQEQSTFAKAVAGLSTSPYFVKIQVLDTNANRKFTTCVTANLFKGALHLEHGLPYSDDGILAIEKLATSNQERAFTFKSPSALQNMPWHPSATELSEAQALVATLRGEALATSLKSGALRSHYADHSRRQERMAALACALIDRGLVPRLADIPGSLYVEE